MCLDEVENTREKICREKGIFSGGDQDRYGSTGSRRKRKGIEERFYFEN